MNKDFNKQNIELNIIKNFDSSVKERKQIIENKDDSQLNTLGEFLYELLQKVPKDYNPKEIKLHL